MFLMSKKCVCAVLSILPVCGKLYLLPACLSVSQVQGANYFAAISLFCRSVDEVLICATSGIYRKLDVFLMICVFAFLLLESLCFLFACCFVFHFAGRYFN
jgi:hypothetical protein